MESYSTKPILIYYGVIFFQTTTLDNFSASYCALPHITGNTKMVEQVLHLEECPVQRLDLKIIETFF